MQFMRFALVEVLIALHLSTESCCHFIPDSNRSPPPAKKNAASAPSESIQICGPALTTFIIEMCGRTVGSLSEGSQATDSEYQTNLTDDCCERACSPDYLQSYCGNTPLFSDNFRNRLREKSVSKEVSRSSGKIPRADQGPSGRSVERGRSRGLVEVRVRDDNNGKRKLGRSRKKKKRSFKRKCGYRSFGHYLLKLDRGAGSKSNLAKGRDNFNQSRSTLQVGTVSPEMDKFGGQPIVVVKKNKFNSV